MKVPYSYLDQQFADIGPYLDDVGDLVRSGDFTLGAALTEFEERFAALIGLPYAIGVGTGTDALMLSLEILGVGPGDEVITSPNTFVATVGAIAMCGARPVFVDNNEEFTIDVAQIADAITERTKAIMPVHLSGCPADMPEIMKIADAHGLVVVEDAAQAILASIDGKSVGSWGATAGFSLHPLKNLNVWGDGGLIVTRSEELRDQLRLFRNHGLATRDEIEFWGHNSRLDTLQAVIGNRLIGEAASITDRRIENARAYDEAFADLAGDVRIPPRRPGVKQVYHTYVLRVRDRDGLFAHLERADVEAKIHYPIPLHLQRAAAGMGYKEGDFPVCEEDCRTIITLPVHQHLTDEQVRYVVDSVRSFYSDAS
jgi:dTDP-3-amino-2,3,6-trideoxy-4-keto-D-glucose/dTDP-3-amino-3,4,6-trideoxy-alpha-D-glucose/dTDP-2,6-dideoxy-D-kanosamine transaminase